MEVFAQQCLDLARAILSNNLAAINEDGTITPVEGENPSASDSGRVAFALGEFYRATGQTTLGEYDIVDLAARALTAQVYTEADAEAGMGFVSLGLLSFGPSKERNGVWERLMDETREQIDHSLLQRTDFNDFRQAFNIAKAVARFSIGLSKKDETSKLIDLIVSRTSERSSEGFVDNAADGAFGGAYDLRGLWAFGFIRQALQLHANIHMRDRKVASLRTVSEKYLKIMPEMIRPDGMGWAFGSEIGIYTQISMISLLLQAMRDNWIVPEKLGLHADLFRKLFSNFFASYIDAETGFVHVRDGEREAISPANGESTRLANFDAARALCQWSRLCRNIKLLENMPEAKVHQRMGRWVFFDRSTKKEQGVFTYNDRENNIFLQLPLMAGRPGTSDSLAFPHMPGVFDWAAERYLPTLLPELTFEEGEITPSYYGKGATAGLSPSGGFFFKYNQPEAITANGELVNGLGSWQVQWNFNKGKISADFIFTPKKALELKRFRFMIALGSPHSSASMPGALCLGEEGQRCEVLKDDFQAAWRDVEEVTADVNYRGVWGNIHYLQTLERSHAMNLQAGQSYRFSVSFEPQVVAMGAPANA